MVFGPPRSRSRSDANRASLRFEALRLSQQARRWGRQLCQFVPVWLWQRIFPEPASMPLLSHGIGSQLAHVKHYEFLGTAEFERDLRGLESGFAYVSYEQIVDRRQLRTRKQSDTSVCLTFDDGFAECISVVRPILLRHGATCIFFIVTDLIDNHAVFLETRASLCVDAILRYPVDVVEGIVRDLGLEARLLTAGVTRLSRDRPRPDGAAMAEIRSTAAAAADLAVDDPARRRRSARSALSAT